MNLGLSQVGNNWKLIIGNFLITFGAQVAFNANEWFAIQDVWPSEWTVCRTILVSLTTTLLFYGFNRFVLEKKE